MKRYITIILLTVAFALNATAQMSDSQIIEFVQKEQKAGTSQAQIVTKLMQKGVKIDQIRRLKKMYDTQGNSSVSGARDLTGQTADRSRIGGTGNMLGKTSGTMDEQNGGNTSYMISNNSMDQRRPQTYYDDDDMYGEDYDDESDWALMHNELNSFMPDSTEIMRQKYMKRKYRKKVFGRNIFNNTNLSFEPNMNIATPENYVLGPGDAVFIDIYGATQKSFESTVSPDGDVVIEGYGPVRVSGLTVQQANNRLRNTIGSRYSSSKVRLTVGQTRTIMVNVMGEVRMPGTYTLSAFATVFHALYMAGGVNNIGTLRNIKVFRKDKLVTTVDIYDYILNGKLTGNIKLADNDVIQVGTYDCLVNITGKVKRPMYYEMKKTESMQSLLKYAGGFTGDAYTKSIRVIRKTGRDYSVHNVSEFDLASFLMNDEDSVSVDSIIPRFSNMVELRGAAFRTGMYQLGGEITSVRTLVEYAEGLKEDAISHHAVMHRMKKDRTLEVVSLDIAGILDGSVADVPLQNEDVLFIPSRNDVSKDQTISIYGEVYYPGVYNFAENETVEDFILQAGGLKESASTMNVEVNRRVNDSKSTEATDVRSKTFRLTLKDGFVVDGEQGFKLEPYDEVYVRKNPAFHDVAHIKIDGEVLYRGEYSLEKQGTRLSDIVKMTGGLTPHAYVKGAHIVRKMDKEEQDRVEEFVKMNMEVLYNDMVDKSVTTSYNPTLKEISLDSIELHRIIAMGLTYKVGIDLEKALKKPGSDDDLVLRDGDILVIPENKGTVTIRGEVNYPNTVTYSDGKKFKYYLRQAGGVNAWGKRSGTYVIQANGKVGTMKHGMQIDPGAEIIVPRKGVRPTDNTALQKWLSIGTSVGSLSTMIATVVNLMRN